MKKIFITGASGFIGQALSKTLSNSGIFVRGSVRSFNDFLINSQIEYVSIEDINHQTCWKNALGSIDCIIHCAGIAHRMNSHGDLDAYYLVNTEGTKNLAEQAVRAGVKRFIFLSTIKINGETTEKNSINKVFAHNDKPNPQDNYGKSKLEAEKVLRDIASKTGLEVVILRLPIVYGKGVKGNLNRLIKLIKFGIPLPLQGIINKRSLIGIDNLIDLIIRCIDSPNASGKTFLASDGKDLSTPELVNLLATNMGHSVKLFSIPIILLKFFGFIFRRKNEIDRLTGSMQIDISYTKKILNWIPPISVEEGIKRMFQGK